MLASLRAFATSVAATDLASSAAGAVKGACDVVVLTTPSVSTLQGARSLLREGGHLYMEVDRRLAVGAVRSPGECQRLLLRARFEDIRLYCPWTAFETSTAFVPLAHPGAMAYFLSRHEQGLTARARATAG
jgi:hypothetical protein